MLDVAGSQGSFWLAACVCAPALALLLDMGYHQINKLLRPQDFQVGRGQGAGGKRGGGC
jgi:hypothetical protein